MMKVILCASDAGGISNIIPLIPACLRQEINVVLLTYRKRIELFSKIADKVNKVIYVDEFSINDLRSLIENIRPEAVICGTTRFISSDRMLIPVARRTDIRSVVVFDEWFNYSYRFINPDTLKMEYLPDAIAFQDEQAKKEAVLEGVPEGICYVTGSPALAELVKKAQGYLNEPPCIPSFLKESKGKPIVTFISETHAADYGTSPGSRGPLGPFIGYTEDSVLENLMNVLSRLSSSIVFVEKLHPTANIENRSLSIPSNLSYFSVRETNLIDLLWYSDIVVGMRSMALLEAYILNCETVSYQPELIGPERCTAVRMGLVQKIIRERDLESWITEKLTSVYKKRGHTIHHQSFAPKNASENVIDLALNRKNNK